MAFEKAKLAETAYGLRIVHGERKISQRVELLRLAYHGQNPTFDLGYLEGQIKSIADSTIRKKIAEIHESIKNLPKDQAEEEWKRKCSRLRIKKRDGSEGQLVKKVTQFISFNPEFKDLSKDSSGSYYKGADLHQGQWIYKENGEYKLKPVYVHESIAEVRKQLCDEGKEICIFVKSGCLIKLNRSIDVTSYRKIIQVDKKPKWIFPEESLPKDTYKWRTIVESSKFVTLENTLGQKFAIKLDHLCNAGLSRVV